MKLDPTKFGSENDIANTIADFILVAAQTYSQSNPNPLSIVLNNNPDLLVLMEFKVGQIKGFYTIIVGVEGHSNQFFKIEAYQGDGKIIVCEIKPYFNDRKSPELQRRMQEFLAAR